MENLDNMDKGLGWVEKVLALIKQYKLIDFIKAFAVIMIAFCMVSFILAPEKVFERFEEWRKKEHTERVEIAMRNSQLIQYELETVRERTGADRAILLTFHNQKQSLNGVPYIYLTAQNESLAYGIVPVAEKYEVLKCSLYPFVNYIIKNNYFSGDIEELATIDKSLAYRMMGNDVKHTAFVNIEGDTLLGVLVLTYTEKPNHNCKQIETHIRKSATKIGILLGESK